MKRIAASPGPAADPAPGAAHDLSRASTDWRDELPSPMSRARTRSRTCACAEAFALAIDEDLIARTRDARPGAPDLADVGTGRERLRRRSWTCGPSPIRRKAKQLLAEAGYPDGFTRRLRLPERPLCDGRADLHRDLLDAGADRRQGRSDGADQGEILRQDPWRRNTTPTSSCSAGPRRPMTRTTRSIQLLGTRATADAGK